MNTVECILSIENKDDGSILNIELMSDLVRVKDFQKAPDLRSALSDVENGCFLDGKKCPEFIFMDLDKNHELEENFYEQLARVNETVVPKIQLVIMLDPQNPIDLEKFDRVGIEYLLKPINKQKLQNLFDRYFLLKNPVI